jgi:hypothetical protein
MNSGANPDGGADAADRAPPTAKARDIAVEPPPGMNGPGDRELILGLDQPAPEPQRLSDALDALAQGQSDRLSLDDALEALGARSFGSLMLAMALPAMLLPPGAAALLGAPLVVISGQLMIGRPRPWLPRRMRGLSLSRERARKVLGATAARVRWLEQALQPRLASLCRPWHARAVAAACVCLSVVLMLPAPFAHTAAALGVVAFAAGLMEADGLALLAGWGFSLCCGGLMALLISGAARGIRLL